MEKCIVQALAIGIDDNTDGSMNLRMHPYNMIEFVHDQHERRKRKMTNREKVECLGKDF